MFAKLRNFYDMCKFFCVVSGRSLRRSLLTLTCACEGCCLCRVLPAARLAQTCHHDCVAMANMRRKPPNPNGKKGESVCCAFSRVCLTDSRCLFFLFLFLSSDSDSISISLSVQQVFNKCSTSVQQVFKYLRLL